MMRTRIMFALALLTLESACVGPGRVTSEQQLTQQLTYAIATLRDPTTRTELIDKCIVGMPARLGKGGPESLGGMLGLDTKDVLPIFCRRLVEALAAGQITAADCAAIQRETASPDIYRRVGEVMAGRPLSPRSS